VLGSLYDNPNDACEIGIRGAMPFPGTIAVDWDGDQESDTWERGAVVRIGEVAYYENNWQNRVYDISGCRGDMHGDLAAGSPDINPFVAALSNSAAYAQMHPGLDGSTIFHGDANCDGSMDFADINPFVARAGSGDCDCAEERGDGMDGDLMPPEDLAAILAENVAPEQYDALLAVVAAVIDAAPNEETQAYWEAVYAALTQ
jgi:hypothetical protein